MSVEETFDWELFDEIKKIYLETKNINETARKMSLSSNKIRKILITIGVYSSERSIEIKKLMDEGYTIDEVAKKLNIARKSVMIFLPYSRCLSNSRYKTSEAIRRANYTERMKHRDLEAEAAKEAERQQFFKEVKTVYESKKSLEKTANFFGISNGYARKILISLGVYKSEKCEIITKLRMEGYTVDEIAEKLGIVKTTVKQFLPHKTR